MLIILYLRSINPRSLHFAVRQQMLRNLTQIAFRIFLCLIFIRHIWIKCSLNRICFNCFRSLNKPSCYINRLYRKNKSLCFLIQLNTAQIFIQMPRKFLASPEEFSIRVSNILVPSFIANSCFQFIIVALYFQ